MWQDTFSLLNGKEGIIRGQLLGGALNYTSRNVIIPDSQLHDNEVDMSYHTFMELFKDRIIRYICISDGCTLNEAFAQWTAAKIRFSDKIYMIMQQILRQDKPMILLNRNPTLRVIWCR